MSDKVKMVQRCFGCSEQQAKNAMAKNLRQLELMAAQAGKTGSKVNGYFAEDLRDIIRKVKKGWKL